MGTGGSGKQSGKTENRAQLRDTIYQAAVRGAKYYEYKDANGKTIKGETAQAFSGDYRERVAARATINRSLKGEYREDVAAYAKMSESALRDELKRLKGVVDDSLTRMNMAPAFSKTGGLIQSQLSADAKAAAIERVLRRREKGKTLYNSIRI